MEIQICFFTLLTNQGTIALQLSQAREGREGWGLVHVPTKWLFLAAAAVTAQERMSNDESLQEAAAMIHDAAMLVRNAVLSVCCHRDKRLIET